jgi:hypothetical protein
LRSPFIDDRRFRFHRSAAVPSKKDVLFSKPSRVSFRFLKFSDSRGRRVFFFSRTNESPLTRALLTPLPDPFSLKKQLAELYETHGQRWAEIARHLEGRTDQQCMGRWRRHLDPSVKKDAWTGGEDDKLMRLHDTLGPRWSNISKMLTGRTAQQCRARWFQLSAADDDATDGNASDATDGATVVTVTVGAAGDEKREASISRKKKMGGAEKKTHSENMSPSTPSVTDEYGTVSAGAVSVGQVAGASSRKRAKDAEKKDSKRRKTLKDSFSSGETGGEKDGGSADYYGNGGGLDMLAMLYSAAVTYEQGVAAVTGSAPSLPAELHA